MLSVIHSTPDLRPLLDALQRTPDKQWRTADLERMGYDPASLGKAFKRTFGMTFLELARQFRLQSGLVTPIPDHHDTVAETPQGFASQAAFQNAMAKHLGLTSDIFQVDALLRVDWFDTQLGPMVAVSDTSHLHLLEFADRKALPTELKRLYKACKGSLGFGRYRPTDQIETQLQAYFAGHSARFTVPLALHGTPFTCAVWDMLQTLPAGTTHSYTQIAQSMGRPEATRAVARANGANQIAIVIPCHRVMAADGALTGYGGGLWRKQKLIDIERSYSPNTGKPA